MTGRKARNRRETTKYRKRNSTKVPILEIAALSLFPLGFIAYLTFFAVERFPEYTGPLVKLLAFETVTGPVQRVRDGDTIEVNEIAIRFGSLNCAERDTKDGRRATGRMQSLISGQTLTCYLNGRRSYDRRIGSCRLENGEDISQVLMRERLCRRFW